MGAGAIGMAALLHHWHGAGTFRGGVFGAKTPPPNPHQKRGGIPKFPPHPLKTARPRGLRPPYSGLHPPGAQIRHPLDASLLVCGGFWLEVPTSPSQALDHSQPPSAVFCRVRCTNFCAEVLPRIWQLGYSIGAVDEKSHATSPVRSAPLRTTRVVRETSIFRRGSGSGGQRGRLSDDHPSQGRHHQMRRRSASRNAVQRTRQKTAGLGGISHQPLPPAK